ncbi:MAG: DUF3795 domain-containing protein [Lachnospiraceae bacterium]|nr:DUF3795 domain-containing protein [Lachnospiraceae bacterium]
MDTIISCCGVKCSECQSFPDDCKGCPEIKGRVYWLEYTGGNICNIYDCCINRKKLPHCGKCSLLPCQYYELEDPTKSEQENAEDLRRQIAQLRQLN